MEEILHQLVDGQFSVRIPLFTLFHSNPNSYQKVQEFFDLQYIVMK